ncbi:MAG: HAMP domain-containing histidine kinase [Notoacmeibacter sp.]|nr:HAMP domain-containing histidine kinase [Notoacmeibacter sp.]
MTDDKALTSVQSDRAVEVGRAEPVAGVPRRGVGLSAKLLVLTAAFVLLAEILIFPPSAANYRLRWMEDKLNIAAMVSILLIKSGSGELSREVQDEILQTTGAYAIAVRDSGTSHLVVIADMPPKVDEQVDLASAGSPPAAISAALSTLFFGGDKVLRIFGKVGHSDMEFEIVIPDRGLREGLLVYSRNIALLSLMISVFTAILVFYAINRVMIRPVRAMTRSMLAFSREPDNPERIIKPEARGDELGIAEHELAAMQTRLQKTLGEQRHLADLGLAVSKINHDMRNVLASAQLISDRLSTVQDPSVQTFAPKLMRTLDRAINYTQSVLAYGQAREAPPVRRRIRLAQLVDEVASLLDLGGDGVEFVNAVAPDLEVDADAEQLFRVLNNLCRNAVQAMANAADASVVCRLTVSATREGTVTHIQVRDTGPGLPKKARENLFSAFRGSARSGGTGLGLAIAHELVRAHGGTIELVESHGGNTVFEITIPDQPIDISKARGELRRHG